MQSFRDLVAVCLVKDPQKRPSSEKLLKHSFFKQARSADFLAKSILEGLTPLGDRFRALKVQNSVYGVAWHCCNQPDYILLFCRQKRLTYFSITSLVQRARSSYHRLELALWLCVILRLPNMEISADLFHCFVRYVLDLCFYQVLRFVKWVMWGWLEVCLLQIKEIIFAVVADLLYYFIFI